MLGQLEQIIRQDAAGRGLTAGESRRGTLAPGELGAAIEDLATQATGVVILTGFYIPHGVPAAAETDGPPGTVLLADVLTRLGLPVWVVTDSLCASAVREAAVAAGWDATRVRVYPWPGRNAEGDLAGGQALEREAWRARFWEWARLERISHCVAIERVGPSHDEHSLAAQDRSGPVPVADFRRRVQPSDRGVCHNMRGVPIDRQTGDLYRLFEDAVADPEICTIGVGDGGNELGMGRLPWEELAGRLAGEQAGRVPCRVGCDHLVIAGISNWGAQALAAGVAWRRGRPELLDLYTPDHQLRALREMVRRGPAVDGITGQATATVDGLEFDQYIAPWESMMDLLRAK